MGFHLQNLLSYVPAVNSYNLLSLNNFKIWCKSLFSQGHKFVAASKKSKYTLTSKPQLKLLIKCCLLCGKGPCC